MDQDIILTTDLIIQCLFSQYENHISTHDAVKGHNYLLCYSHVRAAYTIALSKDTEDRKYRPLESTKDNYPKYVAAAGSR